MNALLICPKFPDTYWSIKRDLSFLGIETPGESGLAASNKLQNARRSLPESVAIIQSYDVHVMSRFILAFDTDREDIFGRMTNFIQMSGVPIAMAGLLRAMPVR